jgi:uncharacterized protein (DUF427 family)
MTELKIKIAGPDHPITIEASGEHVVVRVAGREIANSRSALTLREANYPPVIYVPASEMNLAELERTDHTTYCPYKGQCSYYDIPSGGDKSKRAVWSYEHPYDAVSQIKNHFAFYASRIDSIEQTPL